MYESETQETILTRMLNNINTSLNKKEGSFIFDAISPVSIELAQAYAELDKILELGFAQTTYGRFLDYRAEEHGLTRKVATYSKGIITIIGSSNLEIPKGSIFASKLGIQFATDNVATIEVDGTVDVSVTAVRAGKSGNLPAQAICEMSLPISGITSITNSEGTTGGNDEESDEALLDRLLLKVREPATSGNEYHYLQWAREVNGVGDAKVFPRWDGNGTIKVFIINESKEPADAQLVQNTTDYIDNVRPIGAEVTVESASELLINIEAQIKAASGYSLSELQLSIEETVKEYLKEIVFEKTTIYISQIGFKISNISGVDAYTGLKINGSTDDIELIYEKDNTQVPVLGTVALN